VKRFRESRFLIVGRGRSGEEQDFLGAKGRYVEFDELQELYDKVDRDQAAEWANRWRGEARPLPPGDYAGPSQPEPAAVDKAAGVYLATLDLMKKYGTDSVTMNCLGGFAAGKLPAYPCLGFRQILNDGGQGVCEAMPDDTLSMLMARILTGRPGYVSDPAVDTSTGQICYSHCVATTKPFGPQGESNGFRIRTLHNRDPRGACAESLLPPGYMTTSFRTNAGRKQLIVHQAKAVGTLDSERGCRTKLLAEVRGDIGKLFDQWDQFGWHRVTVYGDVQEPLAEFGKALGMEVIQEA
jgi:L-fucose isomerase-like protein